MSTDVKSSWFASRLPSATSCDATPALAREAPYLAVLPWLVGVGLVFLAASGLVLAVYYNPAHAFDSLQFIDRDVNSGWLVHAFHATGTTMVFGAVYLLLFRGIYTRAYKFPGELVWLLQVKVFAGLLLVGWLGYVLTGGAVSYWSLTTAASAAGALGSFPGMIGTWFFGGPDGAGTLARLVVFHIVLALVLFATLAALCVARKAATPKVSGRGAVKFHPYYTSQYFVALSVFALIFAVLVFFAPHFGQNRLNLLPGSPFVVPGKLAFPWYLAPISGLGEVFPGVYGGIFGVVAGLAVVFALPWLDRSGLNGRAGALYKFLVLVLVLDVVGLGWAASNTHCGAASVLLVVFTVWYFLHFLVLTPLVTAMEAE
jgi:ubiquinol-cytochrome c reductase cytochrome b subunit